MGNITEQWLGVQVSYTYRWWEDVNGLKQMGIDVQQDMYRDEMLFRKEIPGIGIRKYAMIAMDIHSLEQKYYTLECLQAHFEGIRKSEPEYRHEGPTNADLAHPAVRNAWDEFRMIKALAIGDMRVKERI